MSLVSVLQSVIALGFAAEAVVISRQSCSASSLLWRPLQHRRPSQPRVLSSVVLPQIWRIIITGLQ